MTNPAPGWYPEGPGSPTLRWWDGFQWTQHTTVAMPHPITAVWPRQAITKTRRVFDHSRHIKWTVLTLGVWGATGYPIMWAWNRYGPEKAVSVTQFR